MSSIVTTGQSVAATTGIVRVSEAPLSLLDPRVGAVLDGTGDQAAKIATAVSLLPSTGGHIYQPPGTLRITTAVNFDRPVRWEGAGHQASIIKAGSGFTGTMLTVDGGWSRISDVQIDGGFNSARLIEVSSTRNQFDNLHFTASTGEAMHFAGTSSSDAAHANQISNARVLNCSGTGIYLQAFAYDQEFENVWVGTCNVGMRIENGDCFFSNLHVWGCTGNGVEVRGHNNRFVNAYVETNGGHGFDIFNSTRTTVGTGSYAWKNQGHGVNISGTSNYTRVIGSNLYDNGQNGVNGSDAQFCQVIGCQFQDDTASAQTQDRPIATTGTADNWIITSNVIRPADHATGGISLVGSNNQIVGNSDSNSLTGYTDEAVDDRVAALIVAGTGISKTYDDTANTLTLAATGGSTSVSKAVRVYASATGQTITSGATPTVDLNTTEFNDDTSLYVVDLTANTITVATTGNYVSAYSGKFSGGTAGGRYVVLKRNGTIIREAGAEGQTVSTASGAAILALTAGDVITLAAYADGGTTTNLTTSQLYHTGLSLAQLVSGTVTGGGSTGLVATNAQTASYTLQASDNGKRVKITSASAVNCTVPSGIFSAGQWCDIVQGGAGQVTVVQGSGVTVNSADSARKLRTTNAAATLVAESGTVFGLAGDVVA